jgi:hypothetical protein
MEYINFLDSISIYALFSDYGHERWVIARDVLAWVLSVSSFLFFGYAFWSYRRIVAAIKEDASIKVADSDSNYYMSELVIGTGFFESLEMGYDRHQDLEREEVYDKVHLYRKFIIALRMIILAAFCGLVGAEWGIIGFCLIGCLFLAIDNKARYYCEKYEKYVNEYMDVPEDNTN